MQNKGYKSRMNILIDICNKCEYKDRCETDENIHCPLEEDEPGMGQWDLLGD